MWEAAWEVADKYDWRSEYFIYETILLAGTRRSTDLTKGKQRRFEGTARAMPPKQRYQADPAVNVEEQVVNKITVQEILNDVTLSDDERALLWAKYKDCDATLRELAVVLRKKHPQEIQRLFGRVRNKLGPAHLWF